MHIFHSKNFTFKRDCRNPARTLPTCHTKPETTRHLAQYAAKFSKIEARSTEKDARRFFAFITAVTVETKQQKLTLGDVRSAGKIRWTAVLL